MCAVMNKIRLAARSRVTVMLLGETGLRKEDFAFAVHASSPRRDGPFIKMSCAGQCEIALESELFGYDAGAFAGATSACAGCLEEADKGTLFLDEIGALSPAAQMKLLRVLQDGAFKRVGGARALRADVRLVCATSRDLDEAVDKGAFHAELFYALSVVPIAIPPLRERAADIPLIANALLRQFNEELGLRLAFSPAALEFLSGCAFPGNVSQLQNHVLRAAALANGEAIDATDFSEFCAGRSLPLLPSPAPFFPSRSESMLSPSPAPLESRPDAQEGAPIGAAERSDREKLIDAMTEAGWVQARAARLLGLTPRQISYALQKHNIPVRKF